MKKFPHHISAAVLLMSLAACSPDVPMVNLGIDDNYSIYRMATLRLHPEFPGDSYTWTMPDAAGRDSIVGTGRDYYFCAPAAGDYYLTLRIASATDPVEHTTLIRVWDEDVAYSRYITRVLEYRPAPGQFINSLPKYEPGDTEADMCKKVLECIGGKNDVLVSLGNYGGYVTFAFDHTVVNIPGEYDFKIDGNAFYSASNPNPDAPAEGGSSEPGIVMVSIDCNGNGLPDDEWYELAGSEYHKPATLHNYSVTYFRTPGGHIAVPVDGSINDGEYIRYEDSQGVSGYVAKNVYHNQDYWPLWLDLLTLTFSGTCLPPNAVDESGQGSYYVQYAYPWGYADNHPNNIGNLSSFKIDWAVDASGRPVHLNGVDFIRVYTGLNQQCGWLGETSTEISRAEDLHIPDGVPLPDVGSSSKHKSNSLLK